MLLNYYLVEKSLVRRYFNSKFGKFYCTEKEKCTRKYFILLIQLSFIQ